MYPGELLRVAEAEAELSQQSGTVLAVMSSKSTVQGKTVTAEQGVLKVGTLTAVLWSLPPQSAVTVRVL